MQLISFQIAQNRLYVSEKSNSSIGPDVFEKLMKNNESIAYFGRNALEQKYHIFLRAGFTSENAIKVIDSYPTILQYSSKQIENRLEMWHFANFSPTHYYELFVQCPELLELDDEFLIVKRYKQLQAIFVTPKNIWRLLMSSPNVMVDDMQIIQEKVDYILKTMEADETDLVKSGSLGLPLNKIKARHTILVRCGIYKKRNPKASELDPNKNPRLFRIMDTDDKEFASKTCGISIKELETFYELYERELQEKSREEIDYDENTDDEYDNEADTDDENYDPRPNTDYYDGRNRARYMKHLFDEKKKNE